MFQLLQTVEDVSAVAEGDPAPCSWGIAHRLVMTADLMLARLESVNFFAHFRGHRSCGGKLARGTTGSTAEVGVAAARTTAVEVAFAAATTVLTLPVAVGGGGDDRGI